MPIPRKRRHRGAAALAGLLVLAACAKVDVEQARICENLVPALEDGGSGFEIVETVADPETPNAVVVRYTAADATGAVRPHWVRCHFAGGGFEAGRREVVAVEDDRRGRLTDVQLFVLLRFWLGRFESQIAVSGAGPAAGPTLAYLVQQAANAAIVGCFYGLLALAYTLVYGIIGRINLAFGELAMIGAYGAFLGVMLVGVLVGLGPALAVLGALIIAGLLGAAYGLATERLVFRPLRGVGSQAVLIATIGLAIFLQEFVRLTQGTRERWMQPVWTDLHVLASSGGFDAVVTSFRLGLVAFSLLVFFGLHVLFRRTRFGRNWRACADSVDTAALCGVRVEHTLITTFLLSAGLAAVAGSLIAVLYGGVNFHMGTMLGFKALTAAVVGGIGSVPGAILGGFLVAAVETFWTGYLPFVYRDVAVFGLLALFLVFRPNGLLGLARPA